MGPWIDENTADNETLVEEFENACRAGDHEYAPVYKDEILRRLTSNQGEVARLLEALDKCLVGGNSLASVIIGWSLPAGYEKWTYKVAQMYFDDHYDEETAYEYYETWLCWKSIMEARDMVEALSPHTEDTPGETEWNEHCYGTAFPSEDTGIQKVQGIEWIRFVPQVAGEQIEETDYLIFYNGRITQATHDALGGFFYQNTSAGQVIFPYRSISHYAEFNAPVITNEQ